MDTSRALIHTVSYKSVGHAVSLNGTSVCMCTRVRERESVCVCVCMCVDAWTRHALSYIPVCMRVRFRAHLCVAVCCSVVRQGSGVVE